jgi:hypothetical protein
VVPGEAQTAQLGRLAIYQQGEFKCLKETYPFNGIPLFLCNRNSLRSRRQISLTVINVLTEKLKKLFGILSNKRGDLGIPGGDLLQDWLKHVGLLLDELTELLEVGVAAEELEAGGVTTSSSSGTGTSTAGTTATTIAGLSCSFKQVQRLFAAGRSRSISSRSRCCGFLLLLLLLFLDVIGDTLGHD